MSSRSPLYHVFRKKEQELYRISDHIGCLSPANTEYLLEHNGALDKGKVHVCPNSITPILFDDLKGDRNAVREKHGIPASSKVFVYGGNLGKPQCVSFITECLKLNKNKEDRYFLICGDGTDAEVLRQYIKNNYPDNVKMLDMLPKKEYDDILQACDVGLIFLDNRFTIPNFPSRLLSYMEYGLPVLALTDVNTDVGKVITEGGFGWWRESRDPEEFTRLVDEICGQDTVEAGLRGRKYLDENYLAAQGAGIILKHIDKRIK
jgi:glycosyltransferase involved in cell wall biosynthesis